MWAEPEAGIAEIIEKHGLQQITDTGAIEVMVDEVLANNAKAIEQFRSGNEKALNAIVGQVMKASKGKANPAQVQELIKAKIGLIDRTGRSEKIGLIFSDGLYF